MDELQVRLAKCFLAVFSDLKPGEALTATPQSVPGWDSVHNFTLIAVLEEEFGFEIDVEDPTVLSSFERILDYLRMKTAADERFLRGQTG